MCPYIILRSGTPVAAGGAAGGSTIPSTNILAIRNMLAYGQRPGDALAMPRLHNQVLPNVTVLERSSARGRRVDEVGEEVVKGLQGRGHVVEWVQSEYTVVGEGGGWEGATVRGREREGVGGRSDKGEGGAREIGEGESKRKRRSVRATDADSRIPLDTMRNAHHARRVRHGGRRAQVGRGGCGVSRR